MKKNKWLDEIRKGTGVNVVECYQCGKCTAGCPVAEQMDLRPSVILRMLQTNDEAAYDQILRSFSIWLCLTCETCYSRCPMEIDIPQLMDYLRQHALAENKVNPKARDIVAFHQSLLNTIKESGRLNEINLVLRYKMKTGHLLQDATVAPGMFAKGKLQLIPERIKNRKGFSQLFKNKDKNSEL
jgi:heterodisulfide reductase subunit C2